MSPHKFYLIKIARLILKIISNILIVLFLLLIVALSLPYLLHLKPYYVMSGSMESTISYGSVVYVKPAQFQDIKVNDIATFRSNKDPNKSFTHRIIAINATNKTFTTKGDANPTPDPLPIGQAQLVGKVTLTIPYAGYFSALLKNKWILLAAILLLLIALSSEIEYSLQKYKSKKLS